MQSIDKKAFPNPPKLILAPMDGVTDVVMRHLLTSLGGVDLCVSEFIRVTHLVPPLKVIKKMIPEMSNGWRTSSGIFVLPQILGSNERTMAETAKMLIDAGAPGVDVNFGCPAKTVNKHEGGASLLKKPEQLCKVLSAVRHAVKDKKVTAKIRLGWESPQEVFSILNHIKNIPIHWLTIHARTKVEGYQPPAHWNLLKEVLDLSPFPVIANGDIFSVKDYLECKKITGCDSFMIGRGILQDPYLIQSIANKINGVENTIKVNPFKVLTEFISLAQFHYPDAPFNTGRFKQFTKYLANNNEKCSNFFQEIKTLKDIKEIQRVLND